MLRLGIVDFDTSHVIQFTMRLHHVDIPEDQWVEGARVVLGWTGPSTMADPRTIEERRETLQRYGVEMVDDPRQMIGRVDGVLIESVDGGVHLERARPFLEAGVPLFIDKPFTCSLSQAQQLARLAQSRGTPLFSSSSLRYALEIQQFEAEREHWGRVLGAETCSPASVHPSNPGLFNYGIHGVEPLYALMGPGCEALRCIYTPGAEVVVGRWRDGRLGVVRGIRSGYAPFAFTAYCEKGIRQSLLDAGQIYRELLKRIVELFQTGRAPVAIAETVETIGFCEAALHSAELGGAEVKVGGLTS